MSTPDTEIYMVNHSMMAMKRDEILSAYNFYVETLYPLHTNFKVLVNDYYILEDWTTIPAYTTTKLDISGKVAPLNMENTIEFRLAPEETGDYSITWQVETE